MSKENSKYQRLAGNSLLFAVGNFGSKMITFIMLPLYTYKLSTGDFGVSDLILTTVSLLLPIVSLSVFDAVLRFTLEKNSNNKIIFSNSFIVSIIGAMLLSLCFPIISLLNINYGYYVILILIAQIFQSLFSQYAKAIDEIRLFAINGIILSFLTAGLNILFLVIFEFGIQGYLLSVLLANILSDVWLWTKLHLKKEIDLSLVKKKEIKVLLSYSLPLIPNSIAWWTTNAISRYFILYFVGTGANGIFAVANKIPSLLSVMNSIFFQAWQLSAIEEFDSEDKSDFYSNIFSLYSEFLFLGASIILLILRPIMSIMVSPEFESAWRYVPFLLLTVVYSSFSGFLGNYYAAAKKTSGVFTTTVIGAIINIIANFIFIPLLGLFGAGISSAISFLLTWIIRQQDTKKYVETKINIKNIVLNHTVIFGQIVALFLLNGFSLYIIEILFMCLSILVNRKVVKSFFGIISKRKK